MAYFTIAQNNELYYILTMGSFETLAQAKAVLQRLSFSVAEASPGIATIAAINKFIP